WKRKKSAVFRASAESRDCNLRRFRASDRFPWRFSRPLSGSITPGRSASVHAANSSPPSAVQEFESCLAAARTGSTDALGRLLDEYRPYLLGIANEEFDADLRARGGPSDLVQESLMEASRDFANFRGRQQEELLAWLRGILRNNLADFR